MVIPLFCWAFNHPKLVVQEFAGPSTVSKPKTVRMERVPQETLDTSTEYGETSVIDAFQTGNEILISSYEYLAINQHNFVPRAAM